VSRRDQYRAELRALDVSRWPAYLGERSGLPGPRGNIELAQAVADEGDRVCFDRFIATDDEYLVFCGVIGLGRLLAEGGDVEARLQEYATDERWRVREAVAMALQRLGDADPPRLLDLVVAWAGHPRPLVRRAAVAGVCEPRLLTTPRASACAVEVCARSTQGLAAMPEGERRDAGVRALRQAWATAGASRSPPTRGQVCPASLS
jgi:HEAT repeat protein